MCYIILSLIYICLTCVFSRNRCISLPNSCNRATQENTNQRNDGKRIMTEQFPTLGNWVARMSKKQATKSKSKLQSGISLPTASTAEVARVSYIFTPTIVHSMNHFLLTNFLLFLRKNRFPDWRHKRSAQMHQIMRLETI